MKKLEINSVDIAKLAGVSRSTVSRVINNYSNVPQKTREKVMLVIEQNNYVPNASAQVLKGKKNRTIGLFFIDSGNVSRDILSNMLIVRVIEHASSLGYHVLTGIIRNTKDKECVRIVKDIFYQRRIDGGIFIGALNHESFMEELIAEGYIIGIMDHELPGRTEVNRVIVNFNNEKGMQMALDYLISLKHRKIGLINGDLKRYSPPLKYKAFVEGMARHQLYLKEDWVLSPLDGETSEISGYHTMKAFLNNNKELPTAFIAVSDAITFGAIKAFKENTIQVPEDISIIGFDDHALSERFLPPVTTIKVDFNEMMDKLTSLVIQKIEDRLEGFIKFSVEPKLIIRESCRGIKPIK